MKRILIFAAAMAAMTACSEAAVESVTPEMEGGKLVTITADAGATRVAVDTDDWSTAWETGDAMAAINTTSGAATQFTLNEGSEGQTSGSFTGEENGVCYFVYPYALAEDRASETSFVVPIDLTSQQEGLNYNYMFAVDGDDMATIDTAEADSEISLRHITGAFELNMTFDGYDGYTIQNVVVTGLNGKFNCDVSAVRDATSPEPAPITINDGVTTIASNQATVRFNAFSSSTQSVTATAYIKSSEGAVVALREVLTADKAVEFHSGLHHTLDCENMAVVTGLWTDLASTVAFTGGDSVDSPIEISTPEQLARLAADVDGGNFHEDKFFKLTADIDLSAHEWESMGLRDGPKKFSFNGTFDGDGHTISGLYINQPETNYIGLFGLIAGATIKNLSVCGSVVGGGYVGGVVGATMNPYFSTSPSSVTNCYFSGSVVGSGNNVGGVVGAIASSTPPSSVANCCVSGSVVGSGNVGGVVGDASSSSVTNCYNSGSVVGSGTAGGVVGCASSSITNCYNSGSVVGGNYAGGVVGIALSSSSGTNCYNSGSVVGSGTAGGVAGRNLGSGSFTYCYYLEGTADQGVGYEIDAVSGITAKTADYMKGSTFLGVLNTKAATISAACEWKSGTDNFPTLNFGVYQ